MGWRPKLKITKEIQEKLDSLTSAYLDEFGREIGNPNPMFLEVGPRQLSLQEQIQRCLKTELSMIAMQQGAETFEESQDFSGVEDTFDMEMTSKHEMTEEEPDVFKMPTAEEAHAELQKGAKKDELDDKVHSESITADKSSVEGDI